MRRFKLGIQLAILGGLLMTAPLVSAVHSDGAIEGTWGGDRLRLVVDAKGAGRVELDCASGAIAGPLMLNEKGAFAAAGTFEQYRAGPQRADEAAAAKNARYEGTVEGETMTLSIWPEGAAKPQIFKLRKGAAVKLVRCL
jgi:hypothetical protein